MVNIVAAQVLVVGAGLAAYHFATRSNVGAPPSAGDATTVATAPVTASRESPGASADSTLQAPPLSQALSSLSASVRRLEERLAALEDHVRDARSRPTGSDGESSWMGTDAAKGGSAAPDDEIARFDALMQKVEKRRMRERDEATWRRRLKNASISLPANQEDEFAALAAAYQATVRDLFPGGSGGSTVEERSATLVKMEELRVSLVAQLHERFPNLQPQDLDRMFPPAPTSAPERSGPTPPDAGSMGR